jgi:endonuclease I
MAAKLGLLKGRWENISSRDGVHEKNSRMHLDRLQNKYTNCKGVKNNFNFGHITGIQEKLDTTCKQNAL